MNTAELEDLARSRGLDLTEVANALRGLPEPAPRRQLATSERDTLASLGIDVDFDADRGPELAGALRRERLLDDAFTTRTVAEFLGRDPSRIRQRLYGPDRSLLGFHRDRPSRSGSEWVLPGFQFQLSLHERREWAALLQALPPADETSPTALVAWLTTPRDHLGGRSRAEALAEGDVLEQLLAEAATYGMPA